MAKMTRDSLKSLVKECLFEILLEATDTEKLNEAKSTKRSTKRPTKKNTAHRPSLDNIRLQSAKAVPERRPEVDVSSITSDPIMAAIFQDTAVTTLVEQADAERGKPQKHADAAAQTVSNSDPAELFAGASKNWAALAFDD